ncbi:hypothetical protein, partial [Chitinophaga sp.]|uniref:hypothetical protein n=1 Tax=Chitinophaga sp. TaxID=1869181 RepID=UPI002F92D57C
MSNLESFLSLNKYSKKVSETEHINLENLWGDDTFICRVPISTDFEPIKSVELPLELSAIYHQDSELIEFIYATVPLTTEHIGRKFKFYFNEIEFEAYFGTPSSALKLLASGFREASNKSETDYRNLRMFRDFYKADLQTESMKRFFKDKTPLSFYVQGNFSKIKKDFVNLAKHLNFYMRYYDRKTPIILIF